MQNEDKCVMCGKYIPEGQQVCKDCEEREPNDDILKVQVLLDKIADVAKFVQLATKCTDDIVVSSGNYRVNGKSLLGLYSLDLSKLVTVEFYGDVPYEVQEGMKEFVGEE